MFIILIFREFSYSKTLYLFTAKEYLSVFMQPAVFFYTSSSKDFHTLLELVWKKYTMLEKDSYTMPCCRNDKLCALHCMKIH